MKISVTVAAIAPWISAFWEHHLYHSIGWDILAFLFWPVFMAAHLVERFL